PARALRANGKDSDEAVGRITSGNMKCLVLCRLTSRDSLVPILGAAIYWQQLGKRLGRPLDGVIRSDWFSRPDHPGGPGSGWPAPEWIACGQAERKKRGGRQVQAPGRYVRFGDGGLVPVEPDRQPSLLVEDPRPIHHLSHDGRQRGTHLRGGKRLGKRSAQCDFGEQMERAEAITERTPDGREASIRPDESFLNRGVPLCSGRHRRPERLPFPGGLCDGVENIQLHGMDDEAVVVVPVE